MAAAAPPMPNSKVIVITYRMPMRLWSSVSSHERQFQPLLK